MVTPFNTQGIVLIMLVMHLIYAVGFQPRLSVIPGRVKSHIVGEEAVEATVAMRAGSRIPYAIVPLPSHAGTLVLMLPDLVHFVFTAAIIVVMMAFASFILFG